MNDKHYVCIRRNQIDEYSAKGFSRSPKTPADLIGDSLFRLLDPEQQESLMVVEIDAAKHKANNSLPETFTVTTSAWTHVPTEFRLERLEVIKRYATVSMVADRSGARSAESSELHDTPEKAVAAKRMQLVELVIQHRAAADTIESFLREHGQS